MRIFGIVNDGFEMWRLRSALYKIGNTLFCGASFLAL